MEMEIPDETIGYYKEMLFYKMKHLSRNAKTKHGRWWLKDLSLKRYMNSWTGPKFVKILLFWTYLT